MENRTDKAGPESRRLCSAQFNYCRTAPRRIVLLPKKHRQVHCIHVHIDPAAINRCQFSTQLLLQAAVQRGLRVEILDADESLIRVTSTMRSEVIYQATMTRLDTLAGFGVLQNKAVCKKLLAEAGVPLVPGFWAAPDEALQQFRNRHAEADWVIKPNIQFQGTGISFVDRSDRDGLNQAVAYAATFSPTIIAEHWIRFPEYRFLVISGRVHSVINRTPPVVIGDGQSSLEELVAAENRRRRAAGRAAAHDIKLSPPDERRLAKLNLSRSSVIAAGTRIPLRYNSNIHTGGSSRIVEVVHPCYLSLARTASDCLGGLIVGIDLLVKAIHEPLSPNGCYVLEANFNPDISIHANPNEGSGRNPADDILGALGF